MQSCVKLPYETTQRRSEKQIRWLAVLFVFFTFTQYDIELAGGRQNYLLATIPLLLLIISVAHCVSFKTIGVNSRLLGIFFLAFFLAPWVILPQDPIAFLNFLVFNGTLLAAVLFATLALDYREIFVQAFATFIWLSIGSILFQVLYNLGTGTQFDFHQLLFPFSRESEISAVHGFGFERYNGIHLEPGSYAANVGVAMAVYIGLKREIPVGMTLLVLLTLLVTRSASAIMYFGLLSILLYVEAIRKYGLGTLLMTPVLAAVLFMFAYYSGFLEYFINRFASGSVDRLVEMDGSTRVKMVNVLYLVGAGGERQFLGSGFMFIDCIECGFVNSNGAAFAMIFFFGFGGVAIALWLFSLGAHRSLTGLVLIGMLMLSRHTFVQPNFWIPVIVLIAFRDFGKMVRLP